MSIIWTILSVLFAVASIGWLVLRCTMLFNRSLLHGHLIWWIIGPSIFLAFCGGIYVVGEFVINQGPDDWGSMWHARYPLADKYGKWQKEASYSSQGFTKDADGSGSGTYRVNFKYDDHSGAIFCHYDVKTHKFDRDEIDPDK